MSTAQTLDDLTYLLHFRSSPELSFTYQYTCYLNVIISHKNTDLFGDIEELKECFERYPNSHSWLKELLVWINYVLNNWIMLTLYSLFTAFLFLITLPYTEILHKFQWKSALKNLILTLNSTTAPSLNWFGDGLYFHNIYANILQAHWLQSRAVTRFWSGDVQKVAEESSCWFWFSQ